MLLDFVAAKVTLFHNCICISSESSHIPLAFAFHTLSMILQYNSRMDVMEGSCIMASWPFEHWSRDGVVVKLSACCARGIGLKTATHHYDFRN